MIMTMTTRHCFHFHALLIVSRFRVGFRVDLRTLFVAEGLLMLARVMFSARWMHVSRDGGRYLSKASVISILDQIAAIGGGSGGGGGSSGNCIVCDTVCSASLLCHEKWHGHFSWGINFEVRASWMHMHALG